MSEGHQQVVAYSSKTFNLYQRNYCVTRRELLQNLFYARQFCLRTNRTSLRWLSTGWLNHCTRLLDGWNLCLSDKCTERKQCECIERCKGGSTACSNPEETTGTWEQQVLVIDLSSVTTDKEIEELQGKLGMDLGWTRGHLHVRTDTVPKVCVS